jgi:UDP-glucose 4-epimerase
MIDNPNICKVGLTGSTGFLGSAIFKDLTNRGKYVCELDGIVHPDRKGNIVSHLPETLNWVLHFGANTSIEDSFNKPMDIYYRNLNSTMASLDIALKKGSRFLYMSSYIYGHPKYLPIDEKHPTDVINPYMGSKLAGEEICRQISKLTGISVLILRGFTFYGPEQRGNQLIPSVIESIKTKQPIRINDPLPKRDYLFISDFTNLINLIIDSEFNGCDYYNAGGGKQFQNEEVARMISAAAGDLVPIEIADKPRKRDVAECYADIDKVKNDFRWKPAIDLKTGINRCLAINSLTGDETDPLSYEI